jgi:hypothetical protein
MAIGYAPTTPVSTIIAVTPTVLITLDPSAPLTLIRNLPVALSTHKQARNEGGKTKFSKYRTLFHNSPHAYACQSPPLSTWDWPVHDMSMAVQ